MGNYWVKGYPFTDSSRTSHRREPVIHRFDTEKEAVFFRSQVAGGMILPWGDGKNVKAESGTIRPGVSGM